MFLFHGFLELSELLCYTVNEFLTKPDTGQMHAPQ